MILSDFHIHSTFSDGKLTIPEIVDFYGSRGFGSIAVTDHLCEQDSFMGRAAKYLGRSLTLGTFPFYMELLKSEAERAWKTYRMVVLPGVEITKNSFSRYDTTHIVALGIQGWVSPDLSIEKTLEAIHEQDALAVAAHPLLPGKVEKPYKIWDLREEFATGFDAWEISYGSHLLKSVSGSNFPKLGSSDFHKQHHINSWKTFVDTVREPHAILKAIQEQELRFQFYQEEPVDNNFGLSWGRSFGPESQPLPVGSLASSSVT